MTGLFSKKNILVFTIIVLGLISLAAFVLRIQPVFVLGNNDVLSFAGSDDPMYNLRQIELMLSRFPGYAWFDPMTLYPEGQSIHWGPLFTIISTVAVMVAGAHTRPEIIYAALLVPPVMGAIMVPVVFWLTKRISDGISGLFAAVFIAVVSGQYFYRSYFGYLDHHIAEVLFSTLFVLAYVISLQYIRKNPVSLNRRESLVKPAIYGAIAGITFLLGLYVMTTMLMFALIVAIFTLVLFIWDAYHRRQSDGLLLLNLVLFIVAFIGFFAIGIRMPGTQLDFYTIGQPVVFLVILAGTVVLWLLQRVLSGKSPHLYLGSLIVAGLAILGVLSIAAPEFFSTFIGGFTQFFGQNAYALTVQEARSWTLDDAMRVFQVGLVLMLAGFVVLIVRMKREVRADYLFIFIWALMILYATIQHVRYEYYLAVPVSVLAALFVGYALEKIPVVRRFNQVLDGETEPVTEEKTAPVQGKEKKGGQRAKTPPRTAAVSGGSALLALGAVVLAGLFILISLTSELGAPPIYMDQDWKNSLEWFGANTPDAGVDYLAIYDKNTFQYPNGSYGVMSWWDYGHQITYIAKRIPNSNPFQAGVAGPYGSSSFFMSPDEESAQVIADHQGTRYVITDFAMDTGKFWAMATWYNSSVGVSPYQQIFLVQNPENPAQYQPIQTNAGPYFHTLVSRLHNTDGSMVVPQTVSYIEYRDPGADGYPYPVITRGEAMTPEQAQAMVDAFNKNPVLGTHAAVLSADNFEPTTTIDALKHFRLIHESQGSGAKTTTKDIKNVKIFEYVKGARIAGEGVIEIPLVTDAGRNFTYRQASENGSFNVPYSTGSNIGVKALGNYRITPSGKEVAVSEEAVVGGLSV
jgi:dolichyl-diphosphooligosaccharide--protein glycosyltransferase